MCEICRQIPCHYMCPNYEPPRPKHYCYICRKGIYCGEEYIENENGEYVHWDCVSGRDLVEFLGFEIKYMDDDYD